MILACLAVVVATLPVEPTRMSKSRCRHREEARQDCDYELHGTSPTCSPFVARSGIISMPCKNFRLPDCGRSQRCISASASRGSCQGTTSLSLSDALKNFRCQCHSDHFGAVSPGNRDRSVIETLVLRRSQCRLSTIAAPQNPHREPWPPRIDPAGGQGKPRSSVVPTFSQFRRRRSWAWLPLLCGAGSRF